MQLIKRFLDDKNCNLKFFKNAGSFWSPFLTIPNGESGKIKLSALNNRKLLR